MRDKQRKAHILLRVWVGSILESTSRIYAVKTIRVFLSNGPLSSFNAWLGTGIKLIHITITYYSVSNM